MKKFEYKNVRYVVAPGILSYQIKIVELDSLLNQYGSEGWELVSSLTTKAHVTGGSSVEILFIFKREI